MRALFIFICFSLLGQVYAQNALTIEQCEELFKKNNLQLIAEQYNIEAAKASVIQARIWDLPYLSGEFNAYNPQAKQAFDVGNTGQKAIAVQQLIYLGGKKRNEVELAKSDVAIAELQFEQLLRTLRYQIYQNFYGIYYDLVKIKNISTQLSNVDSLTETYSEQAQKGNIPLKDVVRLQSLSLNIKNELIDFQRNIFSEQENLRILTGLTADITPVVNTTELKNSYVKKVKGSVEELQNLALEKNPDYLLYKKVSENSELMIKWQKSLAIPDLTLGGAYDQRGGAFINQTNVTLGIPIPVRNRNKGNIKVAEAQLAQNKTLQEQKMLELKTQVEIATNLLLYQQNQFVKISSNTSENLEIVYDGVLKNFQKRNISLIEFTDFMESYNQSVLLLNEMKKQIILSGEELNLLVNDKVF